MLTAHSPELREHGACLSRPSASAITVAQRRQQLPQKCTSTEQGTRLEANGDRFVVMALGGLSPRKRNVRAGKGGMQVQRFPARVNGFRVPSRPLQHQPKIAVDCNGEM